MTSDLKIDYDVILIIFFKNIVCEIDLNDIFQLYNKGE